MEIGLFLIRAVIGLTLAAHGAQKLFGWFGGPGVKGTSGWLGSMGFRPPAAQAVLAGMSELGGGLLLALGLLTPLGVAAIIAVMVVAAVSVHVPKGFFVTEGGYEYNLILAVAAAGIAFTGPGAWSLDAALGIEPQAWWGLAALAAGLLGAGFVLATRRQPRAQQPQAS